MIDIFGDGPYFIRISELMLEAVLELGCYFFRLLLLAGAALLIRKRLHGRMEQTASLLLVVLQAASVWAVSIRSEFFFSFCLALLLVSELRILNLLPLRPTDYAFLFAALLFPARLFNSTSAVLGHLWIFWILFCALYLTFRMALGGLRGNHLTCYLLFVFLALSMYLCELSVPALQPLLEQLTGSSAAGLVCTVAADSILLAGAAFCVRLRFSGRLEQWNRISRKYQRIEHYFFFLTLFLLLLFSLIYLPFTWMRMQNALVALLIPVLCLLVLAAQLPFLLLLLHVALYRDRDTFRQWEQEGAASYYRELAASVSAMQGIRHDIKNIYFTMGNFVDRSGDDEMKRFFWEKIYPYSEKAILQSELLSKIHQLPTEALRAFFYLKISQAMQQGVSVRLEVSVLPEQFQTGMDVIDLTRILGILLDNSMEEARLIPDTGLEIRVTGNENGCSYIIKNPVTQQTRQSGVHIGKSSKGSDRGNGLRIAKELLEQYPNAALNSILQDGIYIQSLNLLFQRASV